MTRGPMPLMRTVAGHVAWVVTLVLLAPALLGLLPSPASAEERALFADLQRSYCQQTDDGAPVSPVMDHASESCCILCIAPGLPARQPVAEPIADAMREVRLPAPVTPDLVQDVGHAALAAPQLAPITGRGPPA